MVKKICHLLFRCWDIILVLFITSLAAWCSYSYVNALYENPSENISGSTLIHDFLGFWLRASLVPLPLFFLMICRSWNRLKPIEKFTQVKMGGEMILAVGLFVAAALALIDYKLANVISVRNRLEDLDQTMTQTYFQHPNLASLYSYSYDTTVGNFTENAETLLFLAQGGHRPNSIIYGEEGMPLVKELSCKMWSSDTFEKYLPLIPSYFLAERHLYLVYQAWKAYKQDRTIDENDFNDYAAYINEIGVHPIFLAALREAQRWDYVDEKFADDVREQIIKGNKGGNVEILNAIFPDMEDDKAWHKLHKAGDGACDEP